MNAKHLDDNDLLPQSSRTALNDLLMEIAQSASYEFSRPSDLRTTVLISIRICCLLLTVTDGPELYIISVRNLARARL
jgi:hypothetical protein